MMKVLLLVCCLLLAANAASAQTVPGSIMLYGDEAGTVCGIYDNVPSQIHDIYVFHMYATEVTSAEFRVEQQNGAILTWLADYSDFLYVGQSNETINVLYGDCRTSPLHILTIRYLGYALSSDCSYLRVMPSILKGYIAAADCESGGVWHEAGGGSLTINPTVDCLCDVPVEQTAWGRIKVLYR